MVHRANAVILMALFSVQVQAEHDHLEEIVVTAPFQKSAAETALPVETLSGEKLRERVANSLGETLKNQVGVSSASFGPGVGQPIIRGQSGKRVQILQNSLAVTDAAAISPDHANGVEPLLAERIEIVRGPATLLYGSGAIGGVINVIDQRIPNKILDHPAVSFEQSHDSTSSENKTVFGVTTTTGQFGLHFDAVTRHNGKVDIPGFAIDESALERLEVLQHGDEDHDEEHEEEALPNTSGFIGNSDGESDSFNLGLSWITDDGFIGFSFSDTKSAYGLPAGTHGRHEDEDDEDDHEEHDEDIDVRIAMKQERLDLKTAWDLQAELFTRVEANFSSTDYEHRELEVSREGVELGTLYANEGLEGRVLLEHALLPGSDGVLGLQMSDTTFAATGEEAFIPESDIRNTALFLVQRFDQENWTVELGARVEHNRQQTLGSCNSSETPFSLSGSVIYDLNAQTNLVVSASRSERAATIEERFSNVNAGSCAAEMDEALLIPHAATNLIEMGNAALESEVSNNLELGLRGTLGSGNYAANIYYNRISDYIYLQLTGSEVDEQQIAQYTARDARFVGYEVTWDQTLYEGDGFATDVGLFADAVRGSFSSGGNVPRIPGNTIGSELRFYGDQWTVELNASHVRHQRHTGDGELPTEGYNRVSLYTDYHWTLANDVDVVVFARGENLLDEEIRSHSSFLKHYAPEPGRGVRVGLRVRY